MADVIQRSKIPMSEKAAAQRVAADILSVRKTADGVVTASPCYLVGFTITADGTNPAVLLLYDNASAASGTVVGEGRAASTAMQTVMFPGAGVWCDNGLWVDLTTCTVVIYYHT